MAAELTELSNVERQERIARFLEQHQRASIDQLATQFAISPATVRRDLEALVEQGLVERVHGGARAVSRPIAPSNTPANELPALERASEQADDKRRIGAAAAQLVHDGDTVFIGSGTTALEAARNLRSRLSLTVITNSLLVINALADVPAINLISLGGQLRREEMSLIGHTAEHALAEVRADKIIMGIRAIDPDVGLTNAYLPETVTDRAILRIAREVIVVADHTKCSRVAPAFVAPLAAMHTLVTDTNAPPAFIDALRAQHIHVVMA